MSIAEIGARVRRLAGSTYDAACSLTPGAQRRRHQVDGWARQACAALRHLSDSAAPSEPLVRHVFYDGIWENPNYWLRLIMVRCALGLADEHETGVIGPWKRDRVRDNFGALGVASLVDFARGAKVTSAQRSRARQLVRASTAPEDVFDWNLPHGFPGTLLFDGILKRQRRPTVALDDPEIVDQVAQAIAYVETADRLVDEGRPDLVVLSHALDYEFGTFAWAAIRRDIPVLVLYGDFGTSRFIRMEKPEDLFAYPGRPTRQEIEGMAPAAQRSLLEAGRSYLTSRMGGGTDDVSAIYAFQRRTQTVDRATIASRFGWDPAKPILGVYGANWFDFPHVTGLSTYRDFLDWMETTLEAASQNDDVNWLFKAHPVDDWYGSQNGASVEDMARAVNMKHVRTVDRSWNGKDLLAAIDGLVCCHSSAGVEAGHMGKPVLVAHRGWYGDAGFTITCTTRDDYRGRLATRWWDGWDAEESSRRAQLFAGWYYGVPAWHDGYLLPDDSEQDTIYAAMPDFLERHRAAITREIAEIRAWYESDHPYYHIFKIGRAQQFESVTRAGGAGSCQTAD